LVPIQIALCIHCLSNQAHIQYGLITIVECECVLTRVKDGVGIGQSNEVTVFVPFLGSDVALHQSFPMRDRNLCTEVVVPISGVTSRLPSSGSRSWATHESHSWGSSLLPNTLIEYPAHFLVDKAADLLVIQMPQG
jgi:hypothetical protein